MVSLTCNLLTAGVSYLFEIERLTLHGPMLHNVVELFKRAGRDSIVSSLLFMVE